MRMLHFLKRDWIFLELLSSGLYQIYCNFLHQKTLKFIEVKISVDCKGCYCFCCVVIKSLDLALKVFKEEKGHIFEYVCLNDQIKQLFIHKSLNILFYPQKSWYL